MSPTSEFDKRVRLHIYTHIVETTRAPLIADVAQALGRSDEEILAVFERQAAAHSLVLEQESREVRMAMPFSAVPTAFVVEVKDKTYWANCAWDAFGVAAALREDARIHTLCPDCQAELQYSVADSELSGGSGIIHFLRPAQQWWEDIIFT